MGTITNAAGREDHASYSRRNKRGRMDSSPPLWGGSREPKRVRYHKVETYGNMVGILNIISWERDGADLNPEDGNLETMPRYHEMGPKREHKFQRQGSLPIDAEYPRYKPK
jgi:hypothetical protein